MLGNGPTGEQREDFLYCCAWVGTVVVCGFDTELWLPKDQTDSTSFNFIMLQSNPGTVTN